MTPQDIAITENIIREIALAFSGTGYAPHITCTNGMYTVTRRGSLAATITGEEIGKQGIGQIVKGICRAWEK